MRTEVEKTALADGLTRCAVASPKYHVRIEAGDGQVTLTAQNDRVPDVIVQVRRPADTTETGTVAVPTKVTTAAIKTMPDGPVTLTVLGTGDDKQLVLSSQEGSSFTVKASKADAPMVTQLPTLDDHRAVVDVPELGAAFAQVKSHASTDTARPILTGISIEDHNGQLRLVTCDSFRLFVLDTGQEAQGISKSTLIPAFWAAKAKQILTAPAREKMPPSGVLVVDQEWVSIRSERATMLIRPINGTFPNYRELIGSKKPTLTVTADYGDLVPAVDRSKLFSGKSNVPMRLGFGDGVLTLETTDRDVGACTDVVPAEVTITSGEEGFDHDDIEAVAVNAAYFRATILKHQDRVRLRFDKNMNRPVLVDDPNNPARLHLIMPVRM